MSEDFIVLLFDVGDSSFLSVSLRLRLPSSKRIYSSVRPIFSSSASLPFLSLSLVKVLCEIELEK